MRVLKWIGWAVLGLLTLAIIGYAAYLHRFTKRPQGNGGLELRLEAAQGRVGERVHLVARIVNTGAEDRTAIGCLDGSATSRFPRYEMEILGPDGAPVPQPDLFFCGNSGELRETDFVTLRPGGSFNPFESPFFEHYRIDCFVPDRMGKYLVILKVDFSNPNMDRYAGSGQKSFPESVWRLMSRVPLARLEAAVEVEVIP